MRANIFRTLDAWKCGTLAEKNKNHHRLIVTLKQTQSKKQVHAQLAGQIKFATFETRIDCKTVGFFLKISKEISKAWRKSLTRAKRASLTRP